MSEILQLLFIFFLLLLLNVPIAVSIGLTCMYYIFTTGDLQMTYLFSTLFTANDSFPLMAIPFFILAGALMEGGGLSRRLVDFASAFVGHKTGGLAIVTVLTCLFFGAISGSAPATVAAIGAIMVPEMLKQGYGKAFSYSLIAAAGILGIIIPPSIPMVMYGVATLESIGAMFLGGFGPGIVAGIFLILMAVHISKKNGYVGNGLKFSWKRVVQTGRDAIFALVVPIIILGGIYGGFFTATEAASVAVVYGLIAGKIIYKELTFKKFVDSLSSTLITTSTILIIVGTATTLGRVFTMLHVTDMIQDTLLNLSTNKYIILMAINLLLLFVGCIMDTLAAILILAPILSPIVVALGVNPIQFGVMMVLNLAIGLCTPPVGVNLYVASGLGSIAFKDIVKGVLPFLIALLLALLCVTFIPPIVTFLPRLFGMIH